MANEKRDLRISMRTMMIEALERISREATTFADVLTRQQDADLDDAHPGQALTTYFSTMSGYCGRYEALCHQAYGLDLVGSTNETKEE